MSNVNYMWRGPLASSQPKATLEINNNVMDFRVTATGITTGIKGNVSSSSLNVGISMYTVIGM